MADSIWKIGDQVQLLRRPRYLKTADSMPMLRPPDLVDTAEKGVVVALLTCEQLAVRFRRGTFLLEATELESASTRDPIR